MSLNTCSISATQRTIMSQTSQNKEATSLKFDACKSAKGSNSYK